MRERERERVENMRWILIDIMKRETIEKIATRKSDNSNLDNIQ